MAVRTEQFESLWMLEDFFAFGATWSTLDAAIFVMEVKSCSAAPITAALALTAEFILQPGADASLFDAPALFLTLGTTIFPTLVAGGFKQLSAIVAVAIAFEIYAGAFVRAAPDQLAASDASGKTAQATNCGERNESALAALADVDLHRSLHGPG